MTVEVYGGETISNDIDVFGIRPVSASFSELF